MGNDEMVTSEQDNNNGIHMKKNNKRKTPFQLESLENFYAEEPFPTQQTLEDYAFVLNLTYKQVRGWFVEKRRRDRKGEKGVVLPSKKSLKGSCAKTGRCPANKRNLQDSVSKKSNHLSSKTSRSKMFKKDAGKSKCSNIKHHGEERLLDLFGEKNKSKQKKRKLSYIQDILQPDCILKTVFRKDGPPLGVEFDSLPSGAFSHSATTDNQRASKRRKVSKSLILQPEACKSKSVPVKHGIGKGLVLRHGIGKGLMLRHDIGEALMMRHGMGKGLMMKHGIGKGYMMRHGMGKGLMTARHAVNHNKIGIFSTDGCITRSKGNNLKLLKSPEATRQKTKKSVHQKLAEKQKSLQNKVQERRKRVVRSPKMQSRTNEYSNMSHQEECKLCSGELRDEDNSNAFATSLDDEELELRELQEGPNPPVCSANLASDGIHSCSLCKDLLPRFPPISVKMKRPFQMQPWVSSTELVKKLFKAFRFLYTHAVTVDMSPFTLDEFAQAFHDQDSLLLGEMHVALLKRLLSDVEAHLTSGLYSHASKDSRFLAFLHYAKDQELRVKFWNRSLNPLTWTEILRQVLIGAGFGSKQSVLRKKLLEKEGNLMVKCGLFPGTLKAELFSILADQGNNGLKVPELANLLQISDLHLAETSNDLEVQIYSTLSCDISLFEKISPSAYRVRNNLPCTKLAEESDSEDSKSVDADDSGDSITSNSSDDDSEIDSGTSSLSVVKYKEHRKRKSSRVVANTEIDESHPGEMWVLGLMEGEYSNLSIEEKLDALVALVDLAGAGSSHRLEDPSRITTERAPAVNHQGGGKLKRSSATQLTVGNSFQGYFPVAPPTTISNHFGKEGLLHIYLGSDRRYNSYWLFLGPCNAKDPGHRRVYFESSEDGHWEVIDTEEALCALLSILDSRGTREARLVASLEKREALLSQSMSAAKMADKDINVQQQCDQSSPDIHSGEGSSPISDIDNSQILGETLNDSRSPSNSVTSHYVKKKEDQKQKWDRLQAFDAWIWNSFYTNLNAVKYSKRSYLDSLAHCDSCHDLYWRDEKHCQVCHITFELDFDLEERYAIHAATCTEKESHIFPKHKVLSSQLQSLKAAIHAIEAVMPPGALVSSWRVSTHMLWVNRLRRTSSVPELFQVLSDFTGAIDENWLCQCSGDLGSKLVLDEIIVLFPSMPQTTSAIALWLAKLDTLLAPYLEKVNSGKAQAKRNTRQTSVSGNMSMVATAEVCDANPPLIHSGELRALQPIFQIYGRRQVFSGPVVTLKVFEDNVLVREFLEEKGNGRVLVVDGGGSLRCAILGGNPVQQATNNGWAGILINGCIRDVDEINGCDIGVRALASHPMKANKRGVGDKHVPVIMAGTRILDGEWLYADTDGILVSKMELSI
ncbi:hypothetical protein MKW94_018097 [Papaver nudicaule]|uniref:4-hydroxy-4-methyl-2-oxoglutarate aldolase n=2 Tax=Papaver TaxID=3468 RepID=A0AA41VA08_PAPNU|nr:hypothetical protein [Papaver nudicaule]